MTVLRLSEEIPMYKELNRQSSNYVELTTY